MAPSSDKGTGYALEIFSRNLSKHVSLYCKSEWYAIKNYANHAARSNLSSEG